MKNIIDQYLKLVLKHIWILTAIIMVGVFFRTYNFHDWLRFNADQGRDAEVVSAVINGNSPLPLLGPKAGGTQFRLGPAFYYFEIVSAKIFGNYPDKLAYPDLLTGILCIPLLFFFLRKYFDGKIALSLTAIFAVSNYAVRYARFAWNPNSTPFWAILALYAITEIISQKDNRKFLWSAVAGIAVGIGVQLHTTLLLLLPITAIIIFGYIAFKNIKILKYFFVILAMSLLINAPQLLNEYQTGGKNVKAFFGGMKIKKEEASFVEKILHSSSCWVQGNADIISGYEISDTCSFEPGKNKGDLFVFVFGTLFVLGGTLLGLRYLKKESDPDRKYFLALVFVYMAVAYFVFTLIAFELSVRFYLVLIFLPFLLLGFWIKFFREKVRTKHFLILLIATIPFIFSNLCFVQKSCANLASYSREGGGDVNVTILSEAEDFSQFIVANSNNEKTVYLDGDVKFLFKAYKPIRYLVGKSNINLVLINKKLPLPQEYFYIGSSKDKEKMFKDQNIKILQYKTHGEFSVMLIQNISQ